MHKFATSAAKARIWNKISHAHNVSRRRWNVNLRPVRARVNGANSASASCTTCLKVRQGRQSVRSKAS